MIADRSSPLIAYRALHAFLTAITCLTIMVGGQPLRAEAESTSAPKTKSESNWILSESHTLTQDGKPRTYRLYAPKPILENPCPVVLLLHGHGGSADQLLGIGGRKAPHQLWKPIAEKERLILIIPDGLIGSDDKRGWNDARGLSANPQSDDVAHLTAVVENVAKSHPIDRKRIYAAGMSNGGHMALRLAAEASDKFAAVAAIAAANPKPIFGRKPTHPVSILLMNGTDDPILPYEGGKMIRDRGTVQSTNDTIQYWVDHNQCTKQSQFHHYPDRSKWDGCTASRTLHAKADSTVEVAIVQINSGGHAEPSVAQPYSRLFLRVVGRQNRDIESADVIWDFFKNKTAQAAPIE